MADFPEIIIIRYYEIGEMEATYSNDWSDENKELMWDRLDK